MDPQDQPQNPTPQPQTPPITPPVDQMPELTQSEPEVVASVLPEPEAPTPQPIIEPVAAPIVTPEQPVVVEAGQMPASFDPQSAPALPEAPQAKSNTGLIIGLVVGGVVLLAVVGVIILFAVLGNKAKNNSESPSPSSNSTSSKPNSAEVASSTFDYEAVCNGGSITNAATLSDKASAKIMTFSQSPRLNGGWRYESVGYGKPYYASSTDVELISVVACLEEVKSARAVGQTCDYKDDGKTVTIKYYSSQYELSFYEAKTGKKISEGGTINAPANTCPSFISYNATTLTAYASLDEDALDAKYTDFIAQ